MLFSFVQLKNRLISEKETKEELEELERMRKAVLLEKDPTKKNYIKMRYVAKSKYYQQRNRERLQMEAREAEQLKVNIL